LIAGLSFLGGKLFFDEMPQTNQLQPKKLSSNHKDDPLSGEPDSLLSGNRLT
tara:strand:- start:16 stop:171 length:156 start_codon:yes stop_codon:yes gene_type:complete